MTTTQATGKKILISRTKVSKVKLAWAAGVFVGEGHVSVENRTRKYLICAISMNDKRAMVKFARAVAPFVPHRYNWRSLGQGVPITSATYAEGKETWRIHLGGRVAEAVIRGLWPYLKGTDKGTQSEIAFEKAGLGHPSEELSMPVERNRKLSTDDIANIRIMCKNGTTQRECALIFGVTEGAIRYHLKGG
jgi:hypothetical protein